MTLSSAPIHAVMGAELTFALPPKPPQALVNILFTFIFKKALTKNEKLGIIMLASYAMAARESTRRSTQEAEEAPLLRV